MNTNHFGRGAQSRTLSLRYGCPAQRHRGLQRRQSGVYCQSCERAFDVAIDLRDDVAVRIEDGHLQGEKRVVSG